MSIGNPVVEVSGGANLSMQITTLTFPVGGAYGLVAVVSQAVPTGCSDPTNGAWTQLQQITSGSGVYLTIYGKAVIAGTPTITVTCATAFLLALGGSYVTNAAFDVAGSTDNNFTGSASVPNAINLLASPITTTGADIVLGVALTVSIINGSGVLTVGSGYTQLTTTYAADASAVWLWQYLTQGSAGAVNPPATVNGQCDVLSIVLGLKPTNVNTASIAWVS